MYSKQFELKVQDQEDYARFDRHKKIEDKFIMRQYNNGLAKQWCFTYLLILQSQNRVHRNIL